MSLRHHPIGVARARHTWTATQRPGVRHPRQPGRRGAGGRHRLITITVMFLSQRLFRRTAGQDPSAFVDRWLMNQRMTNIAAIGRFDLSGLQWTAPFRQHRDTHKDALPAVPDITERDVVAAVRSRDLHRAGLVGRPITRSVADLRRSRKGCRRAHGGGCGGRKGAPCPVGMGD